MVAVNAVPSVTGKMAVDARSACGPSLFCDLMSLDQYLAQVRPGGARRARAQTEHGVHGECAQTCSRWQDV